MSNYFVYDDTSLVNKLVHWET